MTNIIETVTRIKDDLESVLSASCIAQCFRRVGHHWRERKLGPVATVQLFLQQILHGNVACREVRHLAKGDQEITAPGYCQARMRLPLAGLQRLLRSVGGATSSTVDRTDMRWRGHRVYHVDGSGFSMPDTPQLQLHFGQPGGQQPGCGFPVAHFLALFHAATGFLIDAVAAPLRTHDLSLIPTLHTLLKPGDILVGDTAFCSYAHFALLLQQQAHGVFPNHQRRIIDFRPNRPYVRPDCCGRGKRQRQAGLPRSRWIKALGRSDQLVEWFKPEECPVWLTQEAYDALPASLVVRELRRRVHRPDGRRVTVTVVTTLLDPDAYPAKALIQLHERRWDVETNLGYLKTAMGLEVLRCHTVTGVTKELLVYALVYNLVRVVMLEAAARQCVPVSRISFIDAYTWLRHAEVGEELPQLVVNPYRPERLEPRVVKRRPKQYPRMRKPRDQLRQELLKQ